MRPEPKNLDKKINVGIHSFLRKEEEEQPAFTYPSTGSTNVLLMVGKPNWYFVQIGITNTKANMNMNTAVFNPYGDILSECIIDGWDTKLVL